MNVARLQELVRLSLARRECVDVTEGGRRIRIELGGAPPQASAPPSSTAPAQVAGPLPPGTIAAPCFGIVHLTPAPGAASFVQVGDVVSPGQRLCLVEAMKVFNAVEATDAGRVVEILVASGEEVGRGQALLRLDIADGG